MSYEFYKVLHFIGFLLTVLGLFGLCTIQMNNSQVKPALKKGMSISHGVGLLLLLVAGFGLAAKRGWMNPMPHWIFGKLAIWLVLGGLPVLIKKKPEKSGLWLVVVLVLLLLAIIFAVMKPF
jgi:uncharacterized membrane protein